LTYWGAVNYPISPGRSPCETLKISPANDISPLFDNFMCPWEVYVAMHTIHLSGQRERSNW